ncbi:MAG: UDP-N-acetylmuramoyl-L-alanyl-D-glutamate--2,6-diaminopimelate ligase [Bacilli bacterium]|nr:UDP-N-acetylmuramoyl-L-alanyl-D-glutamate--2,6-diaminopimelate ligase [Bacilli bacterium]
MKLLKDLVNCDSDLEITGVTSDSRKVEKGFLFVAEKGFFTDHIDFIDSAIEKGAVAAIVSKKVDKDIYQVEVPDVNSEFISILEKFYDKDKWTSSFIGITGTDGKTTTATIINKILNYHDDCAYIGTNGIESKKFKITTNNTTPIPEELYPYLKRLNDDGNKNIIMEVASEALLHKRVDTLRFKYAIFTNLTEDHLNIHKTLDNYIESKKHLFSLVEETGKCIINIDDNVGKEIVAENKNSISYGFSDDALYKIKDVDMVLGKTTFTIINDGKEYSFETPLIGVYNVYNLTAAIIVAFLENFEYEELKDIIKGIKVIPGRSEELNFGTDYKIILDYAHTAPAIENILTTLKGYPHKRLISLTGSAGGREKAKRRLMGKACLENSDLVIFTMDDPRKESVDDIIDDLIDDSPLTNYVRINDREEAIKYALDQAEAGDIVAILGKGRDNYMALAEGKVPYCDYEVIEKYFKDKKVD